MDTKELFQKAQRLFIEGKHKESIEAFTKAIESGEKSEIAYLSRGVAYFNLKEHDKALADFSKAIEANEKNVRAYYYRGIAYNAKSEYNRAIEDLNKAIELKPDYGAAVFARGTAYAQIGNDDEAARNIKTALIYGETAAQGFADTFGMFRTQFNKALALITGERKPPTMVLTEEETEKLKKWLEE